MDNLSLDGKWDLAYFPDGKMKSKHIVESDGEILTWIEAIVPGNCQLDLMKRNHLPDPFVGSNTRMLREQEFFEWWYRKRFVLKDKWQRKRLEILFEGIDAFSTIWLNKRLIGKSGNMFVPHSFNITKHIKPNEENTILVQIRSTDLTVRGKDLDGTYDGMHRYERLWARKAGHSFGWDICPRIVTTGLWRSVSIIPHKRSEITGFFFKITHADQKHARITISATLDLLQSNPGELYLEVCGYCGGSQFSVKTKVLTTFLEVYVHVTNPRLWWPRDMGAPNLYDVTLRLVENSRVLDEKHASMGIRTVRLLQERQPDGGTSFIFVINGERVFAKGSNWVPADAFHSRDMERTPRILELFSDLNCNMIRIWGGGVYESDELYDFCDREGIMVWQDFMYACAIYPQVREFLDLSRREAEVIVGRLRNHPSVVLWCGDNEVDQFYAGLGLDPSENKVNRTILKDVCLRLDPTRPYWPSSPHTPSNPTEPHYMLEGDNHIWHHGTYFKDPKYSEDKSRFISEIGHLAAPSVNSIKMFISEGKIWPKDKEEWNHHFGTHVELQFLPQRLQKMEDSILKYFGSVPEKLESYVLASQIVQAEAFKYWIERARRRKFECGGILWWNMMDCWPQFSDAVVDYYFRRKLAYYYIKRAQRPLLISMGEPVADELPIVIVNDTNIDAKVEFEVEAFSLKGKMKYEMKGSSIIHKNRKDLVENTKIADLNQEAEPPYLFILKLHFEGLVYENHYLYGFVPFQLENYKTFLERIQTLK